MKINRAAIASQLPSSLELGPLPNTLGVVYSPTSGEYAGLSELITETLYGVRPADLDPLVVAPAGHVDVDSPLGRYRLRRNASQQGDGRFTIAGLDSQQVTPNTVSELLQAGSAEAIARVFCNRASTDVGLEALLSDTVAREFRRLEGQDAGQSRCMTGDANELMSRRDAVAREIERRLADRRETSERLEAELRKLQGETSSLAEQRGSHEAALLGVENELAEVESRLRYDAIADEANRSQDQREGAEWRSQIEELEAQIEQWRATLAELELRDAKVRSELSAVHPDEAEPALPLADQRAGLSVARRLVEDLQSEVARLARAAVSQACVCRDAHPRLNPLVDSLEKQLNRLHELGQQQQRALDAQALRNEAEHLARSQEELRKQLDHLLNRRQALWRTTRSRSSDEHLGGLPNQIHEGEQSLANRRVRLEERRRELQGVIAELNSRLEHIVQQQASITHRRSTLLSDAPLEALQKELHELQARLQFPTRTNRGDTNSLAARWRASEWLAKLTDGRFTGIRLTEGGRRLAVITSAGEELSAEALSPADRRLASLSLRLALVGGFAQHGVHLPLLLDEPFEGLDNLATSIVAAVLDDFSRLGFQVVVFTTNKQAADRFRTLGVPLLSVSAGAGTTALETTRLVKREFEVTEPVVSRAVLATRQSPYLLAPEDPIDRFPVPMANRTAVFARSRVRTVGDMVSADPSALAEELDRDDVTAELVSLWQTHAALVCFVPGMNLEVASLLTSIGIYSPDQLAKADASGIERRLTDYLASERGRHRTFDYQSGDAESWISKAQVGMQDWEGSAELDGWRRNRGERRNRLEENSYRPSRNSGRTSRLRVRAEDSERRTRKTRRRKTRSSEGERQSRGPREWKFYLDPTSPVVDAPAIGPKTASHLEQAGVFKVADLLAADAQVVASAIDLSRVTAETVVAWQHQAQLVCRIPQLRGHDAQVLVACGFTAPEEIASMQPAELLEFVEPYCSSTEGQKTLRNNKTPDLAEVSDWINWSRHCRMLDAA